MVSFRIIHLGALFLSTQVLRLSCGIPCDRQREREQWQTERETIRKDTNMISSCNWKSWQREVGQTGNTERKKQEKPWQIPSQDWLQLPPAHWLQRPLTSQTTSAPYTESHNGHFWKFFLVEISEQLCVPPCLLFFFQHPKTNSDSQS